MTRHQNSDDPFGKPLSEEARKLVNEVRLRISQPIHPSFDNDFNIYRFVLNAERGAKSREDAIQNAAKAFNQHLRIRKCLKLDDLPDIPFADNPIFRSRFLPFGEILERTDKSNRLLQYVEYKTITVEHIAHAMKSSESCKFQFWQFEHILNQVRKQEEKTGAFSSIRHIVDMNGYEINPFTMLFVSSGTLQYYSHLFHYENYPELVYPVEMVNFNKWIYMPYKLIKAVMPAGFSDRFRLYDGHFLPTLTSEIEMKDIPETLGGHANEIVCTHAEPLTDEKKWKQKAPEILDVLETLVVHSRKMRYFKIEVTDAPTSISWYFHTDSDVYFGVFYEEAEESHKRTKKEELDLDALEMVYPIFKLTARLVHEYDTIECTKPGFYYVVFHNKHSWIQKRTIELMVQVRERGGQLKRVFHDGTSAAVDDRRIDIHNALSIDATPTH